MVWVRPGLLPAKVMVAPNSPSARAQHSTAPAATPGATSGSVTRRKVVHRSAPSVAAASSYRVSAPRNAPSTAMTRNGIATNASATTTPVVVNGTVIPNVPLSHAPSRPLRPNTSSSATPPTTGGSTSGTVTRARTRRRPRNSTRASSQASGTPRARHTSVARVAVSSDRRSAVSTPGAVNRRGRLAQGARTSSPTSGSTRNASPAAAGSSGTGGRPVARRAAATAGSSTADTAAGYGTWKPAAVRTAMPFGERT